MLVKIARKHPVVFGMVISSIKTSLVDLLVQVQIEERSFQEINWKRNFLFGSFGLVYLGGVQYFIYVPLFRTLFPRTEMYSKLSFREKIHHPARKEILLQVVMDQMIHHPFIYFPCFYATKEIINHPKLSLSKNIKNGFEKYTANYSEDLTSLWKIWIPATMFNFLLSPLWMRIPVTATFSILWTAIISKMRGD